MNNNPPTQGVYTVSGTVKTPYPGCTTRTYQVTGTLTHNVGLSTFAWNATNPQPPPAPCGDGFLHAPSFSYSGSVTNNGCNTGSGTWSQLGETGSFTVSRPADYPDLSPTETSTPRAWSPQYPTVMQYEGKIRATKSFAGRQVFETPGNLPTDTCWYPDSGFIPYSLSGGGWYVGYYFFLGNQFHDDWIGFPPNMVLDYRAAGRTPCLASAGQVMRLYTNGVSGSQIYKTNTLYINLPDNVWVGTARDGAQAWRQYP